MKVRSLLSLLPLLAGIHTQAASAQVTDVVCLETTYGDICVRLFTEDAPNTVANFLKYVNEGDYNNTVIHRVDKNPSLRVMQGGGYTVSNSVLTPIARDAAVTNEYKRPNIVGTIAMAKAGDDPNSATSEWFINLSDNTEVLGTANNAGFTVFGEVVLNGMSVVECVAALPTFQYQENLFNSGFDFNQLPLIDFIPRVALTTANFITLTRAYVTQRDLSDPNAQSTCTRPVPLALGRLEGRSFYIPVRIGDKLYKVVFRQLGDPPVYTFVAETYSIVELKDLGQEAAVFANDTLTVPSISVGTQVFTDLVFSLTGGAFVLQSYNGE